MDTPFFIKYARYPPLFFEHSNFSNLFKRNESQGKEQEEEEEEDKASIQYSDDIIRFSYHTPRHCTLKHFIHTKQKEEEEVAFLDENPGTKEQHCMSPVHSLIIHTVIE